MASSLEGIKAALEQIVKDPRYHDLLSLVKTARNGAVYGTKVRFPHALVMIFLFRSGTFRQKVSLVLRATRHHASNLARFASIYKITMLVLKHYGPTPGKEGPYDSFFAGLLGGYFVFGGRSPRTGKISSVNQQIVVYIFARVALALGRLAVKPGVGFPVVSAEPLHSRISHHAWPAFASLSWGLVMLLFRYHPEDLQPSLRSSMTYIYSDCDSWDSLKTLVWHNKYQHSSGYSECPANQDRWKLKLCPLIPKLPQPTWKSTFKLTPSSFNIYHGSTTTTPTILDPQTASRQPVTMAPCSKVAEALASVEGQAGDKGPGYEAILAKIKDLSSPSTAANDLVAIATSFFGQSLGVVVTKSLLNTFVTTVKELKNDDMWIDVGTRTLGLLAAQPSSFPDAVATIRELVATAHEGNEDFVDAARTLAEIPLDSSQRQVTVKQRAEIWIRIVRNYLEVDDSTAAEMYINKLKNIMHQVHDQDLALHFNLSQARILDAKRDFLSAANKYHEISFSLAIAEEERLHTLSMAAKCAILAPAGPQRSRTLGRLHKDERSPQLPEFGILEKIFLDRLLSPDEVEKFAEGLQPHQLATTADGSNVLAKAVVDHNLLGASKLYSNIRFDALGSLLGLDADKAEDTTARMIEQGRLVGRIDQLDGIVYFEAREASGKKGSGRAEIVVGKEIRRWDANVESLAEEVENITTALHQKFPVFVETHLAG